MDRLACVEETCRQLLTDPEGLSRDTVDVLVRPDTICSMPRSFRHTLLTRLGESGCDAWTLARIAGHSNIGISQRHVHPSEDAVLNALSRLGGHNSGHNATNTIPVEPAELPLKGTLVGG
ncbi:MAG: hypothetical protein DMG96_21930 [Acidobacteria bacterium]|nr:MAG: hypothetical protein DMG98_17680 [Acidobacteriota bacterium]PYV73833.1 MAG: hypothetical protein DMG96_21930 [Acidobacteriota bacterium]